MSYRIDIITLTLLLGFGANAAGAEVVCPGQSGNQRLTRMSVFQGNLKDNIELVPVDPLANGGYINDWKRRYSTRLIVVCLYDRDANMAFRRPDGLHACRVDHTPVKTTDRCW